MTMTASFFEAGLQPKQCSAPAGDGGPREFVERLASISSTALMIVDDASALIGLSKPAELLLGYRSDDMRGRLAATVLPILDRMSYESLTRGFLTFARNSDGRMMAQRIMTIPIKCRTFRGWVVLMRPESPFMRAVEPRVQERKGDRARPG